MIVVLGSAGKLEKFQPKQLYSVYCAFINIGDCRHRSFNNGHKNTVLKRKRGNMLIKKVLKILGIFIFLCISGYSFFQHLGNQLGLSGIDHLKIVLNISDYKMYLIYQNYLIRYRLLLLMIVIELILKLRYIII